MVTSRLDIAQANPWQSHGATEMDAQTPSDLFRVSFLSQG